MSIRKPRVTPADIERLRAELPPDAPPLEWATVQDVITNMHRIRLALADYNNHRGPAVFARDKSGEWKQLSKARLERGVPYGYDEDGKPFVLRHVRIRPSS